MRAIFIGGEWDGRICRITTGMRRWDVPVYSDRSCGRIQTYELRGESESDLFPGKTAVMVVVDDLGWNLPDDKVAYRVRKAYEEHRLTVAKAGAK